MHTCPLSIVSLALAFLAGMAALALGGATWGVSLSWLAVGALAASGLIVWGALRLRDEVRAARWDAGHRV